MYRLELMTATTSRAKRNVVSEGKAKGFSRRRCGAWAESVSDKAASPGQHKAADHGVGQHSRLLARHA